jgi:ABC-type sugar transport system ATPase subunit
VTLNVADLVAPSPHSRLQATVRGGDRGDRVRLHTAAGDLTTWHRAVRDARGDVIIGVSPHDLTLVHEVDGALVGTVARVATTGARRLVEVETAAGRVTVDAEPDGTLPAPGSTVGLQVTRAVVARPDGDVLTVLRWE